MASLLLEAVQSNGKEDVLRALKAGCDVREYTPQSSTPLSVSVKLGYSTITELLLRHGADPTQADRNFVGGKSPLHYAVEKGDTDTAGRLIAAGAFPSAPDSQGFTPLHYAARLGLVGTAKFLLSKGADPEALDSLGKSPYYWATLEGHKECAVSRLPLQRSYPHLFDIRLSAGPLSAPQI
uniref:Ankyrin repeat protein n=1 Tax=Palpitomonas bilix TaxID=652834 RepID=A0A7S3GDK2_9EUKA|mmetsp:Transcript_44587/g.115935  ORF Transcript_44587/g.115935 Transcript_44587/m.115935 type:complete len:181 (+) Transcript_44587:249-791(+)